MIRFSAPSLVCSAPGAESNSAGGGRIDFCWGAEKKKGGAEMFSRPSAVILPPLIFFSPPLNLFSAPAKISPAHATGTNSYYKERLGKLATVVGESIKWYPLAQYFYST